MTGCRVEKQSFLKALTTTLIDNSRQRINQSQNKILLLGSILFPGGYATERDEHDLIFTSNPVILAITEGGF